MVNKTTIGFYGGVGSVTGANFLVDTGKTALLIDCGLQQGGVRQTEVNNRPFPFRPEDIDYLLVTHAHADHIGRIGKLVKDGFVGKILSTAPTKDLASVMIEDAYKIMSFEAERYGNQLLYEKEHIHKAFSLWETHSYDVSFILNDDVTVSFKNAGHILGSAMVYIERDGKKLVCTGDVGNVPQPLMPPPDPITGAHYLITESVYGDRVHEGVEERDDLLFDAIETVRENNGTLLIPAFSLERTQSVLFAINNKIESGEIDPLPVFLDSPLAITVTDIYRKHTSFYNETVQDWLKKDDDIFSFSGFKETLRKSTSAAIHSVSGPKVIIAGSGMSHGGRIRDHEKRYLQDKNSMLLLVGHQIVGSVGRRLQDGAKKVTIDGLEVPVHATIRTIRGFSGHADRDQLLELIHTGKDTLEQVFVVMGEEKSSLFLTQRIHDYLGLNALAPSEMEETIIDL